jgi:hypothetical protein
LRLRPKFLNLDPRFVGTALGDFRLSAAATGSVGTLDAIDGLRSPRGIVGAGTAFSAPGLTREARGCQ